MTPAHRTVCRHAVVAVIVAVAGVFSAGGCGLAAEKRPHEISDHAIIDLVSPATATTSTAAGNELQASLYFVKGQRLEKVVVPAGSGSVTVERALTLLLNGPPRGAGDGLTTAIPPGTTLRRASRAGSTLRIDLSGEIKSLGGSTAKAAYAQLVFTALDLAGVSSVRFAIESDDIDAITDDGSLTVIRARNYKRPLNPT